MLKRNLIIAIAFAITAPFTIAADTESQTTTTTTTTEGNGTITEFAPGETIVLKESSGPVHYRIKKGVTYVTKGGQAISKRELENRVKIGVPVRVHYLREGNDMIVDRVIVEEPER